MTPDKQVEQLLKLSEDRAKFIEDALQTFDEDIRKGQEKLFRLLMKEVAGKLKTDADGYLILNDRNVNAANEVNAVFDKFQRSYIDSMMTGFSKRLQELTVYTEQYYALFSPSKSTINNITAKLDLLQKSIGINAKGGVIEGSFIDKLQNATEVKEALKDYVLNNVSSGRSYDQFLNGFRDMVEGTDQVNGEMMRYYKTYAYDTYNKVDQTERNIVADQLQLEYFVYNGDTINTTREFCLERAGKVFSYEQGEAWNEEDWAGKDDSADFFVNRGGYNCRHTIDWISAEMACYLDPAICEEAGIDPETFEDV